MKWVIILQDKDEQVQVTVTASLSEEQQIRQAIRIKFPKAQIISMTHSSENVPDREE
jgi:hypothetical protein